MAILIEYACTSCQRSRDYWCPQPIPTTQACDCGGTARRRFSARLLSGAGTPQNDQAAPAEHTHSLPGTCTLTPTASRMFQARANNDNRAIEQEIAHQEAAIQAGTLDPKRTPTTDYPGQPSQTPT